MCWLSQWFQRVLRSRTPTSSAPAPGHPRAGLRTSPGAVARTRSFCRFGPAPGEYLCEKLSRSVGFGSAPRTLRTFPVGPETACAGLGLNRNRQHTFRLPALPVLVFLALLPACPARRPDLPGNRPLAGRRASAAAATPSPKPGSSRALFAPSTSSTPSSARCSAARRRNPRSRSPPRARSSPCPCRMGRRPTFASSSRR